MRALRSLLIALTLPVLSGSACGNGNPAAPVQPCGTDVTVTAVAAPLPKVTWSPNCGVAGLSVTTAPHQGVSLLWSIESAAGQIRSGVTYGDVPAGARELSAAQPLYSGSMVIVGVLNQQHEIIGQSSIRIP